MAFKVQLSVSSVPELNSSFYHVSRYLLFFFLLLLIIKYSETDAVKHNRQQRFKAGTVSKDVFLFYCVQEHVESEPLKSWQIIYLLNSCMELSWSILWRHNMCTRSLMCTWIWIKIFICAPFIILIQIRQTIYFLVLHHVDQDDAHKRLSWSRSRSYLLLQSYLLKSFTHMDQDHQADELLSWSISCVKVIILAQMFSFSQKINIYCSHDMNQDNMFLLCRSCVHKIILRTNKIITCAHKL